MAPIPAQVSQTLRDARRELRRLADMLGEDYTDGERDALAREMLIWGTAEQCAEESVSIENLRAWAAR